MRAVASIDGGARGNPGPAGWGVVLDCEGDRLTESGYLPHATNNEAEYHGLLAVLALAHRLGVTSLEVRTDSQLLQRQIVGAYRVKAANLQPLYLEAKRRIEGLQSFRIEHVPRAENRAADRLANLAMDRGLRPPGPSRAGDP